MPLTPTDSWGGCRRAGWIRTCSSRVASASTGPEGSIEIEEKHAAAILNAVLAGTVEWERDPDFGYRVAAEVPGIQGRDRFVLIPRFLYARTGRAYDYAALVPMLKRDRVARLEALQGLDAAIVDAVR